MSHLGKRMSALVDGELGHEARDRALAHVAHCAQCRTALEEERALKERLAVAHDPAPSQRLTESLLSLADPGEPVPPRSRAMPLAPLVPTLPPPGRRGSTGPGRSAPATRPDARGPGTARRGRRVRYVAVGAVSAAALMLGTAFAAGGGESPAGTPVLPPAAELSVEHAATTAGLPLRDPAFDAVTASFGGLSFQSFTGATAP